ncbi:MAG: hypothetical protein GF331_12080 [Chitinivibrionales bacterium]|nr:hypothetical protein [Chitinivibrionales bacterium]
MRLDVPVNYVQRLVESGIDINATCSKGWTPLFYLRKYGEKTEEQRKVFRYLKGVGAIELPGLHADEPY